MNRVLYVLDGNGSVLPVMDNKSLKYALPKNFMDGLYTTETFKEVLTTEPDFRVFFDAEGQDIAMSSDNCLFYNFCLNMALYVDRKNEGKAHRLQEQDSSDLVIAIYDHARTNLTVKASTTLDFDNFKYYVSTIAYALYNMNTYQSHRANLNDSIDAVQSNEDGTRISFLSYDAMLERRVNQGENAQTLSDKAVARTQEVIDTLKDKALSYLPNERDRQALITLMAKRLDSGYVLTSYERKWLSQLRQTIRANHNGETVEQFKAKRTERKLAKASKDQSDKQTKALSKVAKRHARLNSRRASFIKAIGKALIDAYNLKDAQMLEDLKALAIEVSTFTPNAKDDDKALQPYRMTFKSITSVLLATTQVQRENAKALRLKVRNA